jgi:AraC family transcriptional activator of pobA
MSAFHHQLTDQVTGSVVFQIGSFENGERFEKLARYNCFYMLLVRKGKGTVKRDESNYPFDAGCLLCFSIYQPFRVLAEADFEGTFICFHPSFFCLFAHREEVSCNGILFNNLYDTPVVLLNENELDNLKNTTRGIQQEMEKREAPDHDVILSYLKIFLITASRSKQEQQTGAAIDRDRGNPMAQTLRNAIEEHFRKLHSPADYSRLLYASVSVLNTIARQYFGKTLTNLIAERMVTEAKRELYLTAKPVKQIAFELGYRDEFYFSRFFKRHTAVSPAVFRDTVGFNKQGL